MALLLGWYSAQGVNPNPAAAAVTAPTQKGVNLARGSSHSRQLLSTVEVDPSSGLAAGVAADPAAAVGGDGGNGGGAVIAAVARGRTNSGNTKTTNSSPRSSGWALMLDSCNVGLQHHNHVLSDPR